MVSAVGQAEFFLGARQTRGGALTGATNHHTASVCRDQQSASYLPDYTRHHGACVSVCDN